MATSDAPLNVPNVTLAVARNANSGGTPSSGGTSALNWSAPNGLGNKNQITIETDGTYNFGPSRGATQHWQMGTDYRVNGSVQAGDDAGATLTQASPGNVFNSIGGDLKTTAAKTRHGGVDVNYLALGVGVGLYPKSFTDLAFPQGLDSQKVVMSYYILPGAKIPVAAGLGTRVISHSGVTGSFQTEPDRFRGEAVQLKNSVDSVIAEGFVTLVTSTHITVDITSLISMGPLNADIESGLSGGSISGVSSAASASMPQTIVQSSASSTKHFRIGDHFQRPDIRALYSNVNDGQVIVTGFDSSGVEQFRDSTDNHGVIAEQPFEWKLLEAVIDYPVGSNGTCWIYIGGALVRTVTIPNGFQQPDFPLMPSSLGLATPGTILSDNVRNLGTSIYFSEIYMDSDTRRFYVSNSATLQQSSAIERIYISELSPIRAELELYEGSLGSLAGKFLHMMDGNTIIFEGLSL